MQFSNNLMSKQKKNESNISQPNSDKQRHQLPRLDNDIDTKEPEQSDVIMSDPDLEQAKTICTKIREEFNETNDINTFLRFKGAAIASLKEYLKRDSIRGFVHHIVEEACKPMLNHYNENLDIDPFNIECDDATKTIEERKEKLMTYVDFILSKISNADSYPTSLRIICQTVGELAALKCVVKKRNAFVGGIIFLRIFCVEIKKYGNVLSRTPPYNQCAKIVCGNFTLVTKILQNIANRKTKDHTFMGTMAPYISSKFEQVDELLNKLCDIPPQDRELVEPPEDPFYDSMDYKSSKRTRNERRYICTSSQMERPQFVTALPPSLNTNKLCDFPPQHHELAVPPENALITFYDTTDYKSLKSVRDNRRVYDPSQMVQPQLVTSIINK